MIDVLKASAGSGKTFALTKTYLGMVLRDSDPLSFRHILAVTFTNKATSEMKGRILKELHTLSRDPSQSRYTKFFVPSIFRDTIDLQEKSKAILVAILHDYSAFSVSTIDKFVQKTLRSFARELGQFAPYQIELERKPLIKEAVDRVLDNVSENDTELLAWIGERVSESLSKGEKPSIEAPLYQMAEKLKRFSIDREEFSRGDLSLIKKDCKEVIDGFNKRLSECDPAFWGSLDVSKRIDWPHSAKAFNSLTPDAQALFRDRYPMYLTAWTIMEQTWDLGITSEFITAFDEILYERNIMCLDDSNSLLSDIIDDCQAPFVYEKMGVRYEHFLLDEFQDTSTVQWNNFLPLLRESESNGKDSLVVGDVKQSIYRWRDSDWQLLGKGIRNTFKSVREDTLDSNYRSSHTVVAFNNDFFTYASDILGLSETYGDVRQLACSGDEGGYVRADFVEGKVEGELSAIISSINEARSAGASWSDITVLVRGNKEGGLIASSLIDAGIPVITDDSLDVKNSYMVRRLVSLLECVENPDDSIARYSSSALGIGLPEIWHSLTDLSENLLGCLTERFPEAARAEVLYIQSFMDCLRDWTSVYGNNLLGFLRYWKEVNLNISSPPDSDSVRVMTIHKSKGLEFQYVIFPFAEKVDLFKGTLCWCKPEIPVSAVSDRHYPVELNGTLAHSYFARDLSDEQSLQRVDAMNIFYVALTRAIRGLHIISCKPSVACVAAAAKQKEGFAFTNLSQVLYYYCCKHGFTYGQMPEFGKEDGGKDGSSRSVPVLECCYDTFPICRGLKVRQEDSDPDDPRREGTLLHDILSKVNTSADLQQSLSDALESGMISLSEYRNYLSFLSSAVAAHPEWFPSDAGKSSGQSRIRINNEVSIFASDGSVQRPDRVILDPDGSVTIVDFKFGALKIAGYDDQVRRYMDLYRSLGYERVRGFVWYVRSNEVVCL